MAGKVTVSVEKRQLQLTNLHKVLYPEHGFTKGEVIDYYSRIAPVLLPHLAHRALTVKRYPNGVDAPHFFEKNASRGTPEWVRTVTLPVPGSTMKRETIDYVVVEELPTLVWLANLAALELHVPQWQVSPTHQQAEDGPAGLRPRPWRARLDHRMLRGGGARARPARRGRPRRSSAKTSGSKGMQVSAPVSVRDPAQTSAYAHWVATAARSPHIRACVVSRMTKSLRPGKIFVDWSQNNPAKTTVAPYSLRARDEPTVSTPLTWDEVEAGTGLAVHRTRGAGPHRGTRRPVRGDPRRRPARRDHR